MCLPINASQSKRGNRSLAELSQILDKSLTRMTEAWHRTSSYGMSEFSTPETLRDLCLSLAAAYPDDFLASM